MFFWPNSMRDSAWYWLNFLCAKSCCTHTHTHYLSSRAALSRISKLEPFYWSRLLESSQSISSARLSSNFGRHGRSVGRLSRPPLNARCFSLPGYYSLIICVTWLTCDFRTLHRIAALYGISLRVCHPKTSTETRTKAVKSTLCSCILMCCFCFGLRKRKF